MNREIFQALTLLKYKFLHCFSALLVVLLLVSCKEVPQNNSSFYIVSPSDNEVVSSVVTVTASADDKLNVSGVSFKLDDVALAAEDTSAPYSISWDSTLINDGDHVLTAVARDSSGNLTTATVAVSVNNRSDRLAPNAPQNLTATAASTSQIDLAWNVAKDNVGTTGYYVYRNGSQIATTNGTSYSDGGLTASSTHTYTVAAFDAAGNISVQSMSVSETTPAADSTPPSVSFITPGNGDTVAGTLTISASAADDIGVTAVQFKLDGVNVGNQDTASPYSLTWDSTSVTNGSHTLTAVARDAAGNNALTSITVSVSNTSDGQAPSVPTGLAASVTSSSQIKLTWNSSTDNTSVAGYHVYRDGSQIATTSATNYSDNGLAVSSTHTYTVDAFDPTGNTSAESNSISATTSSSTTSYSTSFDLTENPISESGAWTNIGLDWTPVVTSGGIAYGTHHATGFDDSYATLSGFAPDQVAEGTIYITGSFKYNQEVELHLRWSQSAHVATGYEILWQANNSYAYIVRWNGALGDFTILKGISFPRAPVTGDVMKAQIVGSLITVYLNGTQVGSYSDSTWTTGNPGIGFYSDDATGVQNPRFGFTSFKASNY